jgi:AraC-like DNA-binding protein
MTERPLALHQVLRFQPRSARAEVEIVSKKRPEVILRRTRYAGVTIDERVLTRAFAWVPRAPTLQAIVLLDGRARFWPGSGLDGAGLELCPGDAVLLAPSDAAMGRFHDAAYLDLEWTPVMPWRAGEAPVLSRLAPIDPAHAARLGDRLVADTTIDEALFDEAFALFRAVGAPLGPLGARALATSRLRPSEQDLAIARAITAQIADLRGAANAFSFGEHARLSPRQLQRVLGRYFERYRMNATNWRDMRNRYRIHIAIALLSVHELPLATVADEVGYASPEALARAFALLGLPPPLRLREELLQRA